MSKPNTPAAVGGRDPNRESYWRECLRRQSRSGLTVSGFCKREALKESTFYFWRREIRHRDRGPAAAFVEVHVAPVPATIETRPSLSKSAAPLELLLPGDRRLLIRAGCDGGLLRQVVSALASLPWGVSEESNGEGR